MANFDAQVRTDFRDVAGMVVSLSRADIVEDVSNPGFVKKWINRAPGLPSIPFIRQPGDPPPTYAGGRFGDPENLVAATQPALILTGGGEQRCRFDRSRSSFLITGPAFAPDGLDSNQPLAIAYQFEKRPNVSVDQVIADTTSGTDMTVSRRNGAGDAEIIAGGTTVVAGDHDDGTFVFTGRGPTPGTALWQKDGAAYGTGDGGVEDFANLDQFMLGQRTGGSDFLDGILDSFYLWVAQLSPLTLDFVWQTVDADGSNFATDLRAPMSKPIWTDITGDLAQSEIDRLNPLTGVPFRYIRVDLPAAPALHRVQVAAAVNGVVLPDSELGGELFTHSWIEIPGPPTIFPVTIQDAGWSAVFDFNLNQEGHYTLGLTRTNGGAIILHFDVQVAP